MNFHFSKYFREDWKSVSVPQTLVITADRESPGIGKYGRLVWL